MNKNIYKFITIISIIMIIYPALTVKGINNLKIRKSSISGSFYPDNRDDIEACLEKISKKIKLNKNLKDKRVFCVVAPHAGYIYSGETAMYSHEIISRIKPEKIIILGVSHFTPLSGAAIDLRDFNTPLGIVKTDIDLAYEIKLQDPEKIVFDSTHDEKEHSIEIQLPYLKHRLDDFKIVPVVIGSMKKEELKKIGKILSKILLKYKNSILLVSTDMSHFHKYEEACRMDKQTSQLMEKLDIDSLMKNLYTGKSELCGCFPILTAMYAMRELGVRKGEIIKYMNSGDTASGKNSVVGYLSMIYTDESVNKIELEKKMAELKERKFELDENEKKEILEIARKTLESYIRKGEIPQIESDNPKFKTKCGGFVTLKINNNLRGCIGYIQAYKPLIETIQDMAVNASTRDPRFSRVSVDELDKITIEISVLSPLEKIKDTEKIIVGVHGIIIKKGMNSGLLLPQVATENNWNRTEFLENTCWKAGLPADAYKSGAEIEIFSAQVFSEKDF